MNKNQNDRDERRFSFYSRAIFACVIIATVVASGLVVRYDRGLVDVIFWGGIVFFVGCIAFGAWLIAAFIYPLIKGGKQK